MYHVVSQNKSAHRCYSWSATYITYVNSLNLHAVSIGDHLRTSYS